MNLLLCQEFQTLHGGVSVAGAWSISCRLRTLFFLYNCGLSSLPVSSATCRCLTVCTPHHSLIKQFSHRSGVPASASAASASAQLSSAATTALYWSGPLANAAWRPPGGGPAPGPDQSRSADRDRPGGHTGHQTGHQEDEDTAAASLTARGGLQPADAARLGAKVGRRRRVKCRLEGSRVWTGVDG